MDPQLEVQHKNGQLTSTLAKHVDDVKIGGSRATVQAVIAPLERAFGKLTYHEQDFTNVGVHHKVHPDGSVELDQDEYIRALKPIVHPDLVGLSSEAEVSEDLKALY